MLEVFLHLAPRITNLYLLIIIGFMAGRYAGVHKESLAALSFYFFIPLVMFYGVMQTDISISVVMMPIAVLIFSSISCFIVFFISRKFLPEKTEANIMALVAGTGNSGYFGIPIALMLFDEKGVGVYITAVLGMTLFQCTLGYYMTSLGHSTAKDSWDKVKKLPVIYAFILGVIFNYAGIKIPAFAQDFFINIRGAYVVIGMMIIGAGIAAIEKFKFNFRFSAFAILARNFVWPVVAITGFYIDQALFRIFDETFRKALVLASIVPIAADTAAISALLKCHPEEMATTVLISSLIAVIYVPIMVSLFL